MSGRNSNPEPPVNGAPSADAARVAARLQELIPTPVWIVTRSGDVEYVNPRWTAFTGLDVAQSLAKGWQTAVHPDDVAAAIPGGDSAYSCDLRLRRHDGEYCLHWAQFTPSGEDDRWIAVATEVPGRFAAELKRRVEDFEKLFQVLPIGVAVAEDPEHQVIRLNPAMAQILGVDTSANGSTTGPAADTLPFRFMRNGQPLRPEDLPQRTAARTGQDVRNIGLEVLRESGEQRFMFGHATPLFDDKGAVRGTVGAYVDLTDRHLAETALREREAQLHSATQIAGMEIWSVRSSDFHMFATPRIGEWFGVATSNTGQNGGEFFRKIHPDDAGRVRESFYRAFRERVPCVAEFRTLPAPGELHWLLSQGEIVQLPNGEERLLGVMMDITERKRAEEELLHSNHQLEQFAYAASHDLQEPLRTINIYTEFLIREFSAHQTARADLFAHTIRDGVTRMQRLIRDLLTFSRLTQAEAGKLDRVDAMAALLDALNVCQPAIDETGARIHYDPLPEVMADELQLALLFQNLITNGIKYRRLDATPALHIRVEALDPHHFMFTVTDNGIGFEAEHAETIFRPFERLDRERSPGTGLGLAISRRIVERFGGRIWADSKPGSGSSFHFTLRGATRQ